MAGPCGGPPESLLFAWESKRGGQVLVFLGFRRLLEAIQGLTNALKELSDVQRELGPALDRLEALERSRIHFEADVEGMLLKADGKLKAATSAEQRERQLKKANERLTEPFNPEDDGAPDSVTLRSEDARAGDPEAMPAVRLALAPNNKAHAVRTKWGIQ